jgi:hypothetical protein
MILASPHAPLSATLHGQYMQAFSLFLLGCGALAPTVRADDLAQRYADCGELIVTQLVSAPFPHPSRAEGHKYKTELFPAKEHYSDSTVAIFIPKGFRQTARVDFVVHFHGWKNNVAGVLGRYKLIEQLVESGRNAVLVVPQGPRNAPDSFGGKLEDLNGFKRFMDELAATLRQRSSLKTNSFTLGNIVLSGHSGGYQVISSIVDRGGLADHVKEVWLFDALYARTEKFFAWFDQQHGRLLDLYTDHGGTKDETEQLMATLKKRGTPFFTGEETDVKPAALNTNQPIFLHTDLPHDGVLEKHRTFAQFLSTSCLAAR